MVKRKNSSMFYVLGSRFKVHYKNLWKVKKLIFNFLKVIWYYFLRFLISMYTCAADFLAKS